MNEDIDQGFELIKKSDCARLCQSVKDFDYRHGFQHRDVLRLELEGNNHIKSMMSLVWRAIANDGNRNMPFERYVFGAISENYRRVYSTTEKTRYDKLQLLCDFMSGMTESYLIKKHDEFRSLEKAYAQASAGHVS